MLPLEHFIPRFLLLKQNLDGLSQHRLAAAYKPSRSINYQCIRLAADTRAALTEEEMKQSESYLQIVVLMWDFAAT